MSLPRVGVRREVLHGHTFYALSPYQSGSNAWSSAPYRPNFQGFGGAIAHWLPSGYANVYTILDQFTREHF